MGGHEIWAQPTSSPLNGLLANVEASVTRVLDADRWTVAEARTAELIERIKPNQCSEERRNAVAGYVQRLIMKCFACQVFTFGSVPLKTYLPDGDIDMTAFSKNLNLKDSWANEVHDMLENEEKSENAEFCVKEVQYIQAEVKIIKCLVENIVVDISFNQLGGLCTLCFLERIDQIIDQDHLFKRSIILIKAWCYYESRILGAHHGLISTYALEILVLYIFRIFNNSFAGPLEVLYRFLGFFSNFDWDNFCVSLWGPVPVSSLPDMTAEPPRKDDEKLLLSKHDLDVFSSMYSVSPGSQENQGQPFVSKFFNVIDPLRTNNNLGRSVSKGNFYRIRSAFAFGAKRLAGLLECSKDDLISEVNKFFMNTWRQHGTGHRPDAPSPNLRKTQPLSNTESEEGYENLRNHAGHKMMVENGPLAVHGYEVDLTVSPQGITSHSVSSVNQPTHNRTVNLSATSAQTQKTYDNQNSSRVAEHIERSLISSGHVSSGRGQKASRPGYLVNESEGLGRSQFARTRSSPELSDMPTDVSSRRQNKMPETVKSQLSSARSEHTGRRKNLISEMTCNRGGKSSSNDLSFIRHGSSNQDFDLTTDSSCTSNSYHEDTDSVAKNEEFTSFPEVLEMHQEGQDLVNMMAASRVGNLNGPVQLPMNMPSSHLPFLPSPSVVASMGYLQRNLPGMLPENVPLIKPPWGSVMQFSHDLDSSQIPSYYPTAGLVSNPEEFVESGNESSNITEGELEDADHVFWQDQDNGSIRMSIADDRNIQMLFCDDKTVSSSGVFDSSFSQVNNSSGSFLRGQHKFVRDNRGLAKEDCNDTLSYQNNRGQDTYMADSNMNSRFLATTQASSSRIKSSSESSWDGSSAKVSRLTRDKHGRKVTSAALDSLYGKSKNGWQYEDSSSDHVSVSAEDENREWIIPLTTMGMDVVERSTRSTSLGPMETHVHHSSGYEPTQTSSSDSMVPVTPVLVSAGSQPRTGDDTGVVPIAFYPMGPPVPFLAMLPMYPYDSGNSYGSTGQLGDGRLENGHINLSDQNFDSTEDLEQPDAHINTGSMEGPSSGLSEGHKPDILNSDLASHWQNLQFGRFCQNARYHGPLMYSSSPVVFPQVYLDGHFPWDGPGRPLLANMNLLTQIMNCGPQLVPMTPLQPGQSRPSSAYGRYGDEVPRYRGGTGTYLPNPKVSFRDRQSPSTRNHRGSYGYERRDHGDREGSWINSKSRAAVRSHGRNQTEKSSSRSEWLSVADNRPDKSWDSYRREPVASYQNQNSSFSSSSIHGSENMAYGMYPLPAVNSNGVNAVGPTVSSVMMLYSYDPGASYASSSEQLEFGSLGPVHLSRTGEVTQDMDGGPVRDSFDQRQGAYEQGSAHSSPDQPSSPQVHRRVV